MATNTPNYNLVKPDQTDTYNVADFNGNMDVIDDLIKKALSTIMTGASANVDGILGLPPIPTKGQQNQVLTGAAVFKDILTLLTAFTGATASAAGTLGGVPAPTAGQQLNVLTGAGSFQTLATLLAAYGVQYNIAQNGYVKFGNLFGGLIIQWGLFTNNNGLSMLTYPIALSRVPWAIITTEGDPAGWDNNINGIAIAGADLATASKTQANILSKWVVNGGTVTRQGQSVRYLIVGI